MKGTLAARSRAAAARPHLATGADFGQGSRGLDQEPPRVERRRLRAGMKSSPLLSVVFELRRTTASSGDMLAPQHPQALERPHQALQRGTQHHSLQGKSRGRRPFHPAAALLKRFVEQQQGLARRSHSGSWQPGRRKQKIRTDKRMLVVVVGESQNRGGRSQLHRHRRRLHPQRRARLNRSGRDQDGNWVTIELQLHKCTRKAQIVLSVAPLVLHRATFLAS